MRLLRCQHESTTTASSTRPLSYMIARRQSGMCLVLGCRSKPQDNELGALRLANADPPVLQ